MISSEAPINLIFLPPKPGIRAHPVNVDGLGRFMIKAPHGTLTFERTIILRVSSGHIGSSFPSGINLGRSLHRPAKE
eukprot:scaffold54051_cov46-Prasinocladus_malaysianus.AAC.1